MIIEPSRRAHLKKLRFSKAEFLHGSTIIAMTFPLFRESRTLEN